MEEIVAAAAQLRNATEALKFKDIAEKLDEAGPTRSIASDFCARQAAGVDVLLRRRS
jgi:hypothetical protein